MNTIRIITAALMITSTFLNDHISGLPTDRQLRESTQTTFEVTDISLLAGLGDHDSSEEDEDSIDYDQYENSDSVHLPGESSDSQVNDGDEEHNVSQSTSSNTLTSGSDPTVNSPFPDLSDQTDAHFDKGPQISKRNSAESNELHNSFEDTSMNVDIIPEINNESTKDNATDDTTRDSSRGSGGDEEFEEINQGDRENIPEKREDLVVEVPVCVSVDGSNSTDSRDDTSHASETHDQVATNQILPCVRTVRTRNFEPEESTQNIVVAESALNREQASLIPRRPAENDDSRDNSPPAVVDGPDLNHDHQIQLSDSRRGPENSGSFEDNRNITNNLNDNSSNDRSDASNVLISDHETNSTENSALNIRLPYNEIDHPHNVVPGTDEDTDIAHHVPQITHQQVGLNDTANETVAKPNENSDQSQQSQSAIQPSVTASIRDISFLVSRVVLSASTHSGSLSGPSLLPPSSSDTILHTSVTSDTRVSDDGNENDKLLSTSEVITRLSTSEVITRLSTSEVIPDSSMVATTIPLVSPRSSISIQTEQTQIQITTTSLYQPTATFVQPEYHDIITKIVEINDNDPKSPPPDNTDRTEGTLTTTGLSIAPTSVLVQQHSLDNEGNNAEKPYTETSKISTISNLRSSTSAAHSSQTLTSMAVIATSTIGANVSTVASLQKDSTTPTILSTKEASPSTESISDHRPWVPGAVTQETTPDGDHTSANTSSGTAVESETPSSFMVLKFGMSWPDFCQNEVSIRGHLVEIMLEQDEQVELTPDQLQLMNGERQKCFKVQVSEEDEILVRMYLLNKSNHFDRSLTLACAHILVSCLSSGESSIVKNKLLAVSIHDDDGKSPDTGASRLGDDKDEDSSSPFTDPGVITAVTLAAVGGCYCLGLVVLQVIVRQRKRTLYIPGMSRSYSVTSSDSIQLSSVNKSRPNSGLFNPGLDITDPFEPSNPLAFIHLTQFCMDERKIYEEYQRIPSRMPRLSVVPAGEEDKNRYANILPLVNTRVKLHHDSHDSRSSYINANYITGPKNQRQYYIATQAPTDKTAPDFWAMVWQQGCEAIVMLTQLVEDGQVKCANYWPELVGKSAAQRHGDFLVELKQKDVHQEYIASRLEVNNLREIEKREIDHFWYTCWPAAGVPEPISLVKLVLDTRPRYENSSSPLVVHCSPGTGRTCTFIALDLCMRQFDERRVVDVMRTVYVMRQERAGAIQNKEQYALLYNSLNEYATIVVSPGVSAASSATTLHALLSS